MIRRFAPGGDNRQGTKLMRLFWVMAAMIPLAGCALPPALTVISMAVDVASYAASGKTVTDHGISMVLQKDCALIRALEEEGEICSDGPPEDGGENALAVLEPRSDTQIAAVYDDPTPLPADLAYLEGVTGRLTSIHPEAADNDIARRQGMATLPSIRARMEPVSDDAPPAKEDPNAGLRTNPDSPRKQQFGAAAAIDAVSPGPGRVIFDRPEI